MLTIHAVQVCARCCTKAARSDDDKSAAAHACNFTTIYDFKRVNWLVGVVLLQRQLRPARFQNSNTSMHVETSELPQIQEQDDRKMLQTLLNSEERVHQIW